MCAQKDGVSLTDVTVYGDLNLDGSLHVAGGVAFALAGAVSLFLGMEFQSRGVRGVEPPAEARGAMPRVVRSFGRLLRSVPWVAGMLLHGVAIVFQLIAMSLAPLMVVQPVGIFALLLSVSLQLRRLPKSETAPVWAGTLASASGVMIFVGVAGAVATPTLASLDSGGITVLAMTLAGIGCAAFYWFGRRFLARVWITIVVAGVLNGLVACLAKVVLERVQRQGLDKVALIEVVVLVMAAAVGGAFVLASHRVASPHVVVATLTVVDPLTAVAVAGTVLREGERMTPLATALMLFGAVVAITGLVGVARTAESTAGRLQD